MPGVGGSPAVSALETAQGHFPREALALLVLRDGGGGSLSLRLLVPSGGWSRQPLSRRSRCLSEAHRRGACTLTAPVGAVCSAHAPHLRTQQVRPAALPLPLQPPPAAWTAMSPSLNREGHPRPHIQGKGDEAGSFPAGGPGPHAACRQRTAALQTHVFQTLGTPGHCPRAAPTSCPPLQGPQRVRLHTAESLCLRAPPPAEWTLCGRPSALPGNEEPVCPAAGAQSPGTRPPPRRGTFTLRTPDFFSAAGRGRRPLPVGACVPWPGRAWPQAVAAGHVGVQGPAAIPPCNPQRQAARNRLPPSARPAPRPLPAAQSPLAWTPAPPSEVGAGPG